MSTLWLVRRIRAEARHAFISLGYWIRPYDMLADARRWKWQRPARAIAEKHPLPTSEAIDD